MITIIDTISKMMYMLTQNKVISYHGLDHLTLYQMISLKGNQSSYYFERFSTQHLIAFGRSLRVLQ
jgi:hypothetical protein